jgi:hypothetical protein
MELSGVEFQRFAKDSRRKSVAIYDRELTADRGF